MALSSLPSISLCWKMQTFLTETTQSEPYDFKQGTSLELTDISFPEIPPTSFQEIIQELGQVLKKVHVCLSQIPPDKVKIVKTSPLTFFFLDALKIRSANLVNWRDFPFNRFAFHNLDSLHAISTISRRNKPPIALHDFRPLIPQLEIEEIKYIDCNGDQQPFSNMLEKVHADSIVILKDGRIAYEKYFNGNTQDSRHILFSVSKSLMALVVTKLIHEKIIDPEKLIGEYIPELKDSGFGDARVIEVLDMTTGLKFNEDYTDKHSEMSVHFISGGYNTPPEGYKGAETLRVFLPTIQKDGDHHSTFHYVSVNSEVLSWLVEKATEKAGKKRTVNELFEEDVWSKIGAEHDAFIIVDKAHDATWSGGLNVTIRDMARLGQMILNRGKVGNEQLLPTAVFDFMCNRDMRAHFLASGQEEKDKYKNGWSYANQFWWTNNEHKAFCARGIYGQIIYIDPKTKMVFALNSSHENASSQLIGDAFTAFHAISKHFSNKNIE